MSKITEYKNALIAAIDARTSYETAKNSENTSMQKTLTDLRKSLDHDAIASIMLACNVNADFINKSERSNNRFNVYAAEKVANVARMLCSVATLNHYTKAIFATALALEANDYVMTHKDAVCACSKDLKHSDSKRASVLKATRYDKHVSAQTASTQSSSSLNALQQFNVFVEARDEANNVTYKINRESEASKQIAAKLELAL